MSLARIGAAFGRALCAALLSDPARCQLHVVHQGRESASDHRLDDEWAVLSSAFEKTRAAFGDFSVEEAKGNMSAARTLSEMQLKG
jgi:hypothetical protein